jgi:hypothetical protein
VLAGVGKFVMAWVIAGSIVYPAEERQKPAKLTAGCTNFHFIVLRVIRFLFASFEKLSHVFSVLCYVLIIYDYVIDDSPESGESSECFVHSTIIVFRESDRCNPIRCAKEFENRS